jgi:large subunit ribosomal protein L1
MPTVVVTRSKRYKKAAEKARENAVAIGEGIDILKTFAPTKFDQSVELIFSLGIDAKQADQPSVRAFRCRTASARPSG